MASNLNAIGKKFLPLILGIVILAIGIVVALLPHGEMIEIKATVNEIGFSTSADDGANDLVAYCTYKVGGETYDAEVSVDDNVKVGDKITIEYDSDHPANYQTPGGEIIPYVFMGVGAVILIFGIFKLIKG